MVDEERERNGYVSKCSMAVVGSSCHVVNGLVNGLENGSVGDGSCTGIWSEGLQTYKRRKHTSTGSSDSKMLEDGKVSRESQNQSADKAIKEKMDTIALDSSCARTSLPKLNSHEIMKGTDDCSPKKHWRNIVLEHMKQSLSESEGGIRGCIQDALVHFESGCTATVKGSVHIYGSGNKYPSQKGGLVNGSQSAAVGHADVVTNGSLNDTKRCQRVFLELLKSESFSQLCTFFFETFQGTKLGNFFDVSHIDSSTKAGTYETSPLRFNSDIQQIWSKFQKAGIQMVTLAKSLSDKTRTSCIHHICGVPITNKSEDGEAQYLRREFDVHGKREKPKSYGVYKVCACRRCGDEADGRDCLVCDSCEQMFHVSCIEPAVEEIPLISWYCADCTANGIHSPHDNCVVCDRMNAPGCPTIGVGNDATLTIEGTHVEMEEGSDRLEENGPKQLAYSGSCNLCRNQILYTEKVRVCGHPFCPHMYYHYRCLTSKQLGLYGACWYCPSCLCRSCLTDRDDDKIVLCDGCDQAYHIYCMRPPRASIPRGKWFCRKCDTEIRKIRKAKREYESVLIKAVDEGKGAYDYVEKGSVEECEKGLDNSGGVDMLLTAAKTLNYEESLAANR